MIKPIVDPLAIDGACTLYNPAKIDQRGTFRRLYSAQQFAELGLPPFGQVNYSSNARRGTLRGLHYSYTGGGKLVQCLAGSVYDAIVDLRPESKTYGRTAIVMLSANDERQLYVPPGVAHGYLTLTDDARLLYIMYDIQAADTELGVRWNDPQFGIHWPFTNDLILNERDANYPDYTPTTQFP